MKMHATLPLSDTQSVWAATKMPRSLKLTESVQTDVCVVGGGIAGLTTAYLLTQAGKSVVLLDDGPLVSGHDAMHQRPSLRCDRRPLHRNRKMARRTRRGLWLPKATPPRLIASSRSRNELKIDCDFVRLNGYLFLAPGDKQEILDAELAAARRAGLKAEMVARAPMDYDTGPAISFPNQARFHPTKYLAGVAEAIKAGRRANFYQYAR